MRYVKVENDVVKNYTIEQLLTDHHDAIIFKSSKMPNEQMLAKYNVYPLITEPMPITNEDEVAEEGMPKFRNNEWHQTWNVRKYLEEELEEIVNNTILENVSIESTNIFVDSTLQAQRYEICKTCDSLTLLKTCKECGCIMPLKTKLSNAVCPLDKW